ncbi:Poly [ADP-ribose] polymerase tankyrase, partial [Gryllus bimaculatus]
LSRSRSYGDTALHTSARYGHAGVTRILISANCRVSDQNKNGDTALHIAAAMGRRKLTRILLEAGCDRSLKNK